MLQVCGTSHVGGACKCDFVSSRTGVCGFTFSLVLAHVCLANADAARVAAPLQLFRLALSFLGTADFETHTYCFGQPQGVPKTGLTENARALLEVSVMARNEALSALAAAPSAAAVTAGVHQEPSVYKPQWAPRELCVGLVEDACLFDSADKTFNILWRAQLHIKVTCLTVSEVVHRSIVRSYRMYDGRMPVSHIQMASVVWCAACITFVLRDLM